MILLAIEDITERKKIEEALQVSEIRYRRLFETAQDGILILDADTGQITDVNPFLLAMLGYTQEYFIGKKLWKSVPLKMLKHLRLPSQNCKVKDMSATSIYHLKQEMGDTSMWNLSAMSILLMVRK